MTENDERYTKLENEINPQNQFTNENNHSYSINDHDVSDVFYVGSMVWTNGKISFYNPQSLRRPNW